MTKNQGMEIAKFIAWHEDCVSQEDWYDFCEMVLDAVVHDANARGWAEELVKRYPWMFRVSEG